MERYSLIFPSVVIPGDPRGQSPALRRPGICAKDHQTMPAHVFVEALEGRQLLSASLTTVAALDGSVVGWVPNLLAVDSSGNIYGVTSRPSPVPSEPAGPTVFEVAAGTQTATKLFDDGGSIVYGAAALTTDRAGNLYIETIRKLLEVAAGTHAVTTLKTFSSSEVPFASSQLLFDGMGNLYGTIGNEVFEVAADTHVFTILGKFTGSDGTEPSNLVVGGDGNIYGTCTLGGDGYIPAKDQNGNGTVFEITPGSNALNILASFDGADGSEPNDLVLSSNGNLYGSTSEGGDTTGGGTGDGTVFEITAGRHVFTTLAKFGAANGSNPGSLVADGEGDLFGTTSIGGRLGYGTVFEISAGVGPLKTLARFDTTDFSPSNLDVDASGNLYGTAAAGTAVFEITAGSSHVTTLAKVVDATNSGLQGGAISYGVGDFYLYQSQYDGDLPIEAGTIYEVTNTGFVMAPPSVVLQPMSETATARHSVHFVASAYGPPMPTVQWQQSTDGGATFSNITGNTSATMPTLTLSGLSSSQNGTEYRAVFTNSLGTATSNAATLTVVPPPISLVSPAHASPNVVTSSSTILTTMAETSAGRSGLIYAWKTVAAPSGASQPSFSANVTAAANRVTATFAKAGYYRFRCTISDGLGHALATDASVDVEQQATSLRMTPHNKTIQTGQAIQYHAALYDQFGHLLRTQPAVTYSILHGPGTIGSSSGIFTSMVPGVVLIEADEGTLSGNVGAQVFL